MLRSGREERGRCYDLKMAVQKEREQMPELALESFYWGKGERGGRKKEVQSDLMARKRERDGSWGERRGRRERKRAGFCLLKGRGNTCAQRPHSRLRNCLFTGHWAQGWLTLPGLHGAGQVGLNANIPPFCSLFKKWEVRGGRLRIEFSRVLLANLGALEPSGT